MGCVIHLGQVLKIKPGVHLRCGDVGVTQQLLHSPQITAGLQHMAGKRMPQHVRVHRGGQTRFKLTLLEPYADVLWAQALAAFIDEQGCVTGSPLRAQAGPFSQG